MKLSELTGYSWQHIGGVERGETVPSETLIGACDAALLANGTLITLLSAVIREQAHVRHRNEAARRESLRTPSQRSPSSAEPAKQSVPDDMDWDRLAEMARRPSRLTPAMVDDLELITDRQRHLYHELSSAEMLVHVQAHLGLLTAFLDGYQPEPLRHRLASAAAEAAGFAAWLWFDLGDTFSMNRCYEQADAAVTESADRGLGSYINGYQGLVAAQQQHIRAAVVRLDAARETAPRSLSDVTRSWLAALNAEATARTGDRRIALRSLGQARDLLGRAREDETDPWMYEFDQGSLANHAGTCYLALNQPRDAAREFKQALALLPASCDRRGANIQVGLAHARLAEGEAEEAHRLASTALDVFAGRGSVAGLRRLRSLRDTFRTTGHLAAAAALDEQARALRTAG